jgi:tetratricopeptide (TPR) repeat protein
LVLWLLGYPDKALLETHRALDAARETGHIPTLLFGLIFTAHTHICCRVHAAAATHLEESIALAQEKIPLMKHMAAGHLGCVLAETGKASEAINTINAAIAGMHAIGATVWTGWWISRLALAYAELGKIDDAWRCIGEAITAIESSKERWHEAEVNRIAGEIALVSPESDAAKAEAYFERALVVAREQQAKSLELRAAMSMARLWRDQKKPQQANELLAPVYGWFTEGFDTLDLQEAKTLLAALA